MMWTSFPSDNKSKHVLSTQACASIPHKINDSQSMYECLRINPILLAFKCKTAQYLDF